MPDPSRLRRSDDDAEIASYLARASYEGNERVTALSAFQRNADAYPQLDADEQTRLHRLYVAGKEAQDKLDQGAKGRAAGQARAVARRGEQAQTYLVASNFRLALLIARENAERRFGRERASAHLSDLVGEANLALAEAVVSFDEDKCPTFSTWAARVVRDRVRGVLAATEIPVGVPTSWQRIKRIASVRIPKLADALGRNPSTEELQDDLLTYCLTWAENKLTEAERELPEEHKHQLKLDKLKRQGMLRAIREVDEVLARTQSASSLNQTVGTDSSSMTMGDLLASQEEERLLDRVDLDEVRQTVAEALSSLPSDRDREIIRLRFGFADGETWTYARISEVFDVSPERIRQIERNVFARWIGPGSPYRDRLAAFLPSLEGRDLDELPDPRGKRKR